MKKKLIIMILIFIQISMLFISTVQADDDEYYVIDYFQNGKNPIKIKKSRVTQTTKKEEIYQLVDELYKIDIEALNANGLLTLDKLLGDFYNGAYKNLKEEYNSTYNKLYNQDSPNSVAKRMIKAAENPDLIRGYGNTNKEKIEEMVTRRKEGVNPNPPGTVSPSSGAAGSSGQVAGSKTEEQKEKEEREKTTIYQLPEKKASTSSTESIEDLISDADSFVEKGSIKYEDANLQKLSTTLYNMLLSVGVAIALIVGIIIGIKYMMASVEEKANYKQMLVPYFVGCIVVFGAFGIWKLVVSIIESV